MVFLPDFADEDYKTSPEAPVQLRGLVVKGADTHYTSGQFGNILSQSLCCGDCTIWQHHLFIEKPVLLRPFVNQTVYTLSYMMEGSVTAEIIGLGKVALTENSYRMLLVSPVKQKMWFNSGQFHVINLDLPYTFIEELSLEYADMLEGSPILFPRNDLKIDFNIRLLLQDLLTDQHTGTARRWFLEARIRDLLLIFVREISLKQVFGVDHVLLDAIEDFIKSHIHLPLSAIFLAKEFGTNQGTLRKRFKALFGISIHKYIVSVRMQKAQALLKDGRSISETALLVGYSETSSFSRSFIAYFKESPAAFKNR